MSKTYTVVCDGGKRRDMTYGSFMVFDSNGKQLHHHMMVYGFGTSNTAEYMSLINSVKFCLQKKYLRVIFKSDSLLMIQQILGKWRCTKESLQKLKNVAKSELGKMKYFRLVKIHNTEVKKILGH